MTANPTALPIYTFSSTIGLHYPHIVERGAFDALPRHLAAQLGEGRSYAVIADETVARLYAPQLQRALTDAGCPPPPLLRFRAGERSKTQNTASRLIDQMMDAGVHRRSVLIALGGGVTSDTVGYVAATYMRGVEYVNVPTSLIGQVDAAIGGKVAVNHPRAKNFIGAFWHPKCVIIDPALLHTLPTVERKNGLAEAVKVAVIHSPDLFAHLERHAAELVAEGGAISPAYDAVIHQAVQGKLEMLMPDPFEVDLRRVLNFGHTFAHPLEVARGYYLRHGFAVSIGMCISTRVALGRRMITVSEADRIFNLLSALGLPTVVPPMDLGTLWEHAALVRRVRANHVHFVLPRAVGEVDIIDDLSREEFMVAAGAA